jgi:hypothetical protein
MSADIDDNIDVGGFAAVINSRLAAESRILKAIGFGWLCGGVAIAACLTGLGFGFAFYGYSYMLSVRPSAEQTAKALVQALEHANLKTSVSGTMSLSPKSELKLAPGQTVRLDEGMTVGLDPNSSVRVVGDLKVDIPQPSKRQLQLEATSKSEELPFTNYTIFRGVSYGSGEVVTGWNYDLDDTMRPKSQFCYYRQSLDKGVSAKYILAVDASPRMPSPLAKLSFNFDGALSNCIWFSGA